MLDGYAPISYFPIHKNRISYHNTQNSLRPCRHCYEMKVPCVQNVVATRSRSTCFQRYFSKAGLTPAYADNRADAVDRLLLKKFPLDFHQTTYLGSSYQYLA